MVKIIDFVFASRPMLLLPTWSVYLITYRLVNGDKEFSPYAGFVLIGVTLITIGAYFINQIFDYESDEINKKLGFLQKGLIKKSEMMAAYIVVSLLPLVPAFVYNYKTGFVMVAMILLGYAYSAPPFRFKDRPVGGLLANASAYGILVPLSVSGYVKSSDTLGIYIIICFFLMVAAGYMLTIIPDREGDRKSGKNTLATICSDKPIIFLAIIFLSLSLYAAFAIDHLYLMIICAASMILFLIAFISGKNRVILFACKFPILMLSLLAGYYFPSYMVFLLVLMISTRLYYQRRFGIVYPRIN